MNSMLRLTLAFFLLVFIASCQKEPDESIIQQPTISCQLVKAIQYDEMGDILDTSGYVYTSSKVTRIDQVDTYNTLEYSGDKVSRRNYFQRAGSITAAYDNVTYNTDGTPSKVEFFLSGGGLPAPVQLLGYEFIYSGGKLTGYVEKADTSFSGQPLVSLYSYQYIYTGNNITNAIETDVLNGLKDTLVYQYNSTANYYKPVANVLFTDVLFTDLNGQLMPFAVSANNVSSLEIAGNNFPIKYTLDTNKNVSELLIGAVVAARYTYNCK